MKKATLDRVRLMAIGIWAVRVIVGCVFIVSGWAKAIDPWGFVIKVRDYLAVWDMSLPSEIVVTACVALSCVEFCVGILVATGCLKRLSVWAATAMMAFMLPLTVYIAIFDPVSDCGCFGEFVVISNGMTLLKNIVIVGLLVFLIIYNRKIRGLFPAPIQWIVVTVSLAFPLYLAFVGYNVQPLVDFRPYRTGTAIFSPDDEEGSQTDEFIYEKEGRRETFTLDNLPDSTWTFIDMISGGKESGTMGVYDKDGEDVSEILAENMQDMLILVIPDPNLEYLSRAHYVNLLYDYASRHDTKMIAILGNNGDGFEEWKEWTRPRFDVYTAEDTSLWQLSRGDASLVFVRDGIIKWKRTLSSLDTSLPLSTVEGNALEDIRPVDDGRYHLTLVLAYLLILAATYLLGQSPKILSHFVRSKAKK